MTQNKMGRPPAENPKNIKFHTRFDKETMDKLDYCAEKLSTSRSGVLRKGIDMVWEFLKKR